MKAASSRLSLYCFCPEIVNVSVRPNNEVLAMWGAYGLVYTAIGVAHALQGPRHKWRPRIVLLSIALGLTGTAHLLAAIVGFFAAAIFMLYLAEYRRSYVTQILLMARMGALLIEFASFSFHLAAFTYVFTGGSARFWFSFDAIRAFATNLANAPLLNAAAVSLLLFVGVRRSRYFGNAAPLVIALTLCTLLHDAGALSAVIWALPFLFTFVGGVFADALETKYRRLFLAFAGLVIVSQAGMCLAALPLIR